MDTGIFESHPTTIVTGLPHAAPGSISRSSAPRIPFEASAEVRRALETLGRTEDIAFSRRPSPDPAYRFAPEFAANASRVSAALRDGMKAAA